MQRRDDGGLGAQLVGDRIHVNSRCVHVSKLLGEGGFSYVYLVKDISDGNAAATSQTQSETAAMTSNGTSGRSSGGNPLMVLKVTSIHSRQQRDIAEKEAKLLSRLSHPSIIKMYDSSYRTATAPVGVVASIVGANKEKDAGGGSNSGKERPQHLILMEYCEGGHALDVCNKLASCGQRFDLSALIIAFGQICNAVSYLHAQRPPIVHRDLKPVNFLIKNGAYKLCDFGSAVFGHVELRTPRARMEAEEVIQKTTTQMFRAPEMVDLYMAKKLTQSTDVWALGCCLYSLAFLQNCFEEGSNLAILSRNYKIPEDSPYGEGLEELIDRMLTVDHKARADMTEVILCLSAIYSGRPLPPRKKSPRAKKVEGVTGGGDGGGDAAGEGERPRGTYRTDGQGIHRKVKTHEPKKPAEAKKLNPNSAAARRRRAAKSSGSPGNGERDSNGPIISPKAASGNEPIEFNAAFSDSFKVGSPDTADISSDLAFSRTDNPFAAGLKVDTKVAEQRSTSKRGNSSSFNSFEPSDGATSGDAGDSGFISFDDGGVWTQSRDSRRSGAFPTKGDRGGAQELPMEGLSLSLSDSNSEKKERKVPRHRSSTPKGRRKDDKPKEDKSHKRRGSLKGLFSSGTTSV